MRRLFRCRRERVEQNGVARGGRPRACRRGSAPCGPNLCRSPPVCTVSEQSRSARPEPLLLGSAEGEPSERALRCPRGGVGTRRSGLAGGARASRCALRRQHARGRSRKGTRSRRRSASECPSTATGSGSSARRVDVGSGGGRRGSRWARHDHRRLAPDGVAERDAFRAEAENRVPYDALYAEYLRLRDLFGRGGDDLMRRLRRLRG